jgi:endonuclease G
LIAPNLLMTNHHVIPDKSVAAQSVAEFDYQLNFGGGARPTCRYKLDQNRFCTNAALDYTIVGVLPGGSDWPDLENWGCALLNPHANPIVGEHVTIIQHPNGGPKQIALTANQVVDVRGHRLLYTTDTMPGSSGAPVFNDMWEVIAIHYRGEVPYVDHKGDEQRVNGGILMSAIKPTAGDSWPA